jgi:hypothetical protein
VRVYVVIVLVLDKEVIRTAGLDKEMIPSHVIQERLDGCRIHIGLMLPVHFCTT